MPGKHLCNGLQSTEFLRSLLGVFQPLLNDVLHPGVVGLLIGSCDQLLEFRRVPGGGFGLRLGVGLGYARLRSRRFLCKQLQAPAVDKILHADASIAIRLTAWGKFRSNTKAPAWATQKVISVSASAHFLGYTRIWA